MRTASSAYPRCWLRNAAVALVCCAAFLAQPEAQEEARHPTSPEDVAAELGFDLTQPLTVEQCIEIALRVHPDIRIAIADLDQATATLRQTRASLWPSFRMSTDYRVVEQPTRTQTIGGSVIRIGGGQMSARNAQIAGYYSLYEPGRFEGIRQAKQYRHAALAGLEEAGRQLAYLVTQAFYDQLAAERLVAVKQASLSAAQDHVDQVQAHIDADDAAPVEIHSVRAQFYAAQLDLSSARSQAAIGRAALRVALGEPETTITLVDAWQQPSSLPALDESTEAALADRPDIAQMEALVRAAKLGAKLARIQQRPRLNVVGSTDWGRHTGTTGASWSIFGSLEQTIFDGGAIKAAVDRARAELRSTEAQLERLQQTVRFDVESAWLRLRESAEAIAAAEAARDESRAALDAAETRYSANVGILLEITDAQVRADEADVSVVRAYYDYNVALADFERAMAAGPFAPRAPEE